MKDKGELNLIEQAIMLALLVHGGACEKEDLMQTVFSWNIEDMTEEEWEDFFDRTVAETEKDGRMDQAKNIQELSMGGQEEYFQSVHDVN